MPSTEKLGLAAPEHTELLKLLNTGRGLVLVVGPDAEHRLQTLRILEMYLQSQRREISTAGAVAATTSGSSHPMPPWVLESWRDQARVEVAPEITTFQELEALLRSARQATLLLASTGGVDGGTYLAQAVEAGIDPALLGEGILAILTQHSIKKNCPLCRVDLAPSFSLEELFESSFGRLGFPFPGFYLREGRGCHTCDFTGYLGLAHVFEFMRMSPAVQEQLGEEANTVVIDGRAMTEGMLPWEAKLYFRLKHGDIALNDAAAALAAARQCL